MSEFNPIFYGTFEKLLRMYLAPCYRARGNALLKATLQQASSSVNDPARLH